MKLRHIVGMLKQENVRRRVNKRLGVVGAVMLRTRRGR
jgi:hypothetical protein